MRHHGDAAPERHAECIEGGAHRVNSPRQLAIGERIDSRRRLFGFVDDRDAVGVGGECAIEMITDGQWNLHVPVFPPAVPAARATCDAARDKARL